MVFVSQYLHGALRAAFLVVQFLLVPCMAEPPVVASVRWRGFNLTEMTRRDNDAPVAFQEQDFRRIAAWGFNFVRLPLTYEYWVDPQDWTQVVDDALAPIDDAVAWGRKYGLHVCLNFHRAPGYCINPPAEAKSLWTDEQAQRACAAHWRAFARRYRDVPSSELSFNLLNEPPYGLAEATYANVITLLVDAIREEDPDRLIVVDGLDAGRRPLVAISERIEVQATRGYEPLALTHYLANWMPGQDRLPIWPPIAVPAYLYGPWKPELHSPLVLAGRFPEGALRVTVGTVADFASLHVSVDGAVVLDEDFLASKGDGTSEPRYRTQWRIYQTVFDRTLSIPVPKGTRVLRVEVGNGDWLQLSNVEFVDRHGQRALLPLGDEWGVRQRRVTFSDMALRAERESPEAWLREQLVEPWAQVASDGTTVFVGEWGAYNRTPHAVTLRWMEDCLKLWKEQGWGWALWNFRGPFGVLDSGRSDVNYTPCDGHLLDAQMLKLLQRY